MVILHRQEGVTGGDPLAMVMYSLGLLSMTCQLKKEFPFLQCWYADNNSAYTGWLVLTKYFACLGKLDLAYGYFLEPTKAIMVVHPGEESWAKEAFTP